MTRQDLILELRKIEEAPETHEGNLRGAEIIHLLAQCICIHCRKQYDSDRSSSNYAGYCSVTCEKKQAEKLGWRPNRGRTGKSQVFRYLKSAGKIGANYVVN